MRGLGRRVSLLAVFAVIATALLGSAYTLWYENLRLTMNVATATLDGQVQCGNAADNDNTPANWGLLGAHAFYSAPNPAAMPPSGVGNIVASGPIDSTFHTWQLTISNAYPGYALDCEFELFNNGSVPWRIETEVIQVDTPSQQTGYSSTCGAPHVGLCWAGSYPTNATSWTDKTGLPIFAQAKDYRGCSVNSGTQGSFFIGVNQSALEHATYRVTLKFQVNQWNESQWSDCNSSGPIARP